MRWGERSGWRLKWEVGPIEVVHLYLVKKWTHMVLTHIEVGTLDYKAGLSILCRVLYPGLVLHARPHYVRS